MSSSVNPALKAALLGRWERAESPEAPLTSSQRDSVFELMRHCEGRPLPNEVKNFLIHFVSFLLSCSPG